MTKMHGEPRFGQLHGHRKNDALAFSATFPPKNITRITVPVIHVIGYNGH